ncbi:MAG: hypothetical protein PHY30_02635 [Candidatus Pacebacteria bacterium]|nr:hypothetical protein [Candidatus Paceibacterota bacterium]
MLFSKDKKHVERELDSLKQNAIERFKFGIRRINNGEDPRRVGELELAIKELKNYQENLQISNEEMLEILKANKISLEDREVKSAIEKSFITEFSKALDICKWYKEIMGAMIGDRVLDELKDNFIRDLKWTSNYKEMIEMGELSDEFILSPEVREAAKERFLELVKEGDMEEIRDFIQIFKLEDLDFAKEAAENRFVDLVRAYRLDEAEDIKGLFDIQNVKDLLPELTKIFEGEES